MPNKLLHAYTNFFAISLLRLFERLCYTSAQTIGNVIYMSIVTIGINHKTTPLAIRERFSFNHDCTSLALQDLMRLPSVNEAVLLSTCNRTEIYTISNNHFDLPHWLQHHGNLRETDIFSYCYHHQEIDAIKHLMRVA